MVVACGVDIIYIPGIKRIQRDQHMLDKFFDPTEIARSEPEHLAGIIAAKEAFFKALGIVPKFREITVMYEKSGKPKLIVSPAFQQFASCDVSISHDGEYAVGFVVLQK